MRFTAFDFETCNGKNLSAVDLGIAVYEYQSRWRLMETRCWRFYPIEDEFWERCSRIHGIFKHHVEGLPGFAERWPDIEPYFRDSLLVAHNALFDVRILCSHLDYHQIERPNSSAQCTMSLAGTFMRGGGGNLADLCKQLRIPLQHHNSVSDAVAAGRIYAHLHDHHGTHTKWAPWTLALREWMAAGSGLADDFDQYAGVAWEDEDAGQLQEYGEQYQSQSLAEELYSKAECCFRIMEECSATILDGWAFSITGDMLIERDDFVELARKLGARCGDRGEFYGTAKNVHGPTNALIISDQELRDIIDGKPPTKKLRDAIVARGKGKPMVILPEEHFYDIVIDCSADSSPSIPRDDFQECPVTDLVWSIPTT